MYNVIDKDVEDKAWDNVRSKCWRKTWDGIEAAVWGSALNLLQSVEVSGVIAVRSNVLTFCRKSEGAVE
jgi:hypothetical protein